MEKLSNYLTKKAIILITAIILAPGLHSQDLHHYMLPTSDTINHASVTEHFRSLSSSVYKPIKQERSFKQFITDKIFHENLFVIHKDNYYFTIDPIFGQHLGREFVSGEKLWENTRAFNIQGTLILRPKIQDTRYKIQDTRYKIQDTRYKIQEQPTLSFSTSYFESQYAHAPYLDSIVRFLRATPGQLRPNDASYAEGWIRYEPNRIFSFEAGHGKNFIGNGYRSLLLSDGATPYPYFRIDTKIWRVHYVNLWAELQDINFRNSNTDGYQKKYTALHYLSFAITNRFEAGLFEVVNWQGRDSTHHRGFDINYLNPVIVYRAVEWTMGSPDNVLMGANLNYRFGKATYVYGQFIMDEFSLSEVKSWSDGWWANKMGWQIGAKTWIPLQPATRNRYIFLQTEFNAVRPYTYSHWTSKQNYGHYNQPLAHPLGANFMEWVNFIRLRWDRVIVEGRYSWAQFGSDFNGSNYGHNIFLSTMDRVSNYDVFISDGLLNTLTYKTLTTSYLVNSASNFNIFLKLTDRHQVTELKDKHDLMFQFGVRSSIRNIYYDF